MGIYGSKSIITIAEARDLVGYGKWEKILTAFKRISNNYFLDYKSFQKYFLGAFPLIPNLLVDHLFNAFDMSDRGVIGEQEFCCGLAIMLRGSMELQYNLLFYIYENQHSGFVEMDQLRKLLDAVYSEREAAAIDAMVALIFTDCSRDRRLDYHEFSSAVQRVTRREPTALKLLTQWFQILCSKVMEEPAQGILDVERAHNPDIALSRVARKYKLSNIIINVFENRHTTLKRKTRSGKFDREMWENIASNVFHPDLADRIFTHFSRGLSLQWTIAEFVQFCCTSIYGSRNDQATMLFALFDEDRDGALGAKELELMIESLAWHHLHREKLLPHQKHCRISRRRHSSIDSLSAFDQMEVANVQYGLSKVGIGDQSNTDISALAQALLFDMKALNEKYTCNIIESIEQRSNALSLAGFMAWLNHHEGRYQILKDMCYLSCIECGSIPTSPVQYGLEHNEAAEGYLYGAAGTSWFIISSSWWKRWEHYTNPRKTAPEEINSMRKPGPIDNKLLLDGIGPEQVKLHKYIRIYNDFNLIPPKAWEMLQKWYGGGPSIERTVVMMDGKHVLDLWPLRLKIRFCDQKGKLRPNTVDILFSKSCTAQDLLYYLARKMKIEPDTARIWNYYYNSEDQWRQQKMLELNRTLCQNNVEDNQELLLEISLPDGSWPRSQLQSNLEAAEEERLGDFLDGNQINRDSNEVGDGLVGLINLGNTCYLSSSVQCVSHTPFLTEYFLSDSYLTDLNPKNPLGSGGELAKIYAQLVRELWKAGSLSAVNPKYFKSVIAKFNEQFVGHDQHDAQELLDVLINGLHEDLNRITNKPYIEQPDSDGRPDSELADIWWKNHLQRDLSVIMNLFSGQFRSQLTCSSCGYASARFEPFTFLQLPLPEESTRPIDMILFPIDGSIAPIRFRVPVLKNGTVRNALEALSSICCGNDAEDSMQINDDNYSIKSDQCELAEKCRDLSLDPDWLLVAELASCRIVSHISPERKLTSVRESEILHVYQLEKINEFKSCNVQTEMSIEYIKDSDTEKEVRLKHLARTTWFQVIQRSLETQSIYFLNRFKLQVDARELYTELKKRLSRLIKDNVGRISAYSPNEMKMLGRTDSIGHSPTRAGDRSKFLFPNDHEEDINEAVTYGWSEHLAAGPLNEFGFRLRYVNNSGNACSRCDWLTGCVGCFIPPTDAIVKLSNADVIAVDWHMKTMHERYDMGEATMIVYHPNVDRMLRMESKPLHLLKCLETFSAEETIPEGYCSKCKTLRKVKMKMGLWRLPPILVIQLKRFQYTQYSRRKLRNLVEFPVTELDLSPFILNEQHMNSENVSGLTESAQSVSLTSSHASASPKNGRMYDLYGVVHHLGALSSGHYVASVKSQVNGKWHYFNDNQVSEMDESELVNQSAYILFYARRDLGDANLLVNIQSTTSDKPNSIILEKVPRSSPMNGAKDSSMSHYSGRCVVA